MRSRTIALVVALALGAGACASSTDEQEDQVALDQSSPGAPEADGKQGTPGGKGAEKSGRKGTRARGDEEKGPGGGSGKASGEGDSGDDNDKSGRVGEGPGGGSPGPDGRDPSRGDAPKSRSGSALAPAAGTYVYAQDGFEQFCSATCDRQKLPSRQPVETTLVRRSGRAAVVETEMRASRNRVSRTTTSYTRAQADITQVHVRFTYAGYTFERTYRPKPTVESLRFPLSPGESWSGSWRGDVSGDYSVSVTRRESISAAGKTIEAVRVETATTFRGDFEGRANATLWIDPRTKAVLKTAGNLSVKSNFGTYSTGFATSLQSGPGY